MLLQPTRKQTSAPRRGSDYRTAVRGFHAVPLRRGILAHRPFSTEIVTSYLGDLEGLLVRRYVDA